MNGDSNQHGRSRLGIVALIVAVSGLGALMASPELQREADRRMDRVGKIVGPLAIAMLAYWYYRG